MAELEYDRNYTWEEREDGYYVTWHQKNEEDNETIGPFDQAAKDWCDRMSIGPKQLEP